MEKGAFFKQTEIDKSQIMSFITRVEHSEKKYLHNVHLQLVNKTLLTQM